MGENETKPDTGQLCFIRPDENTSLVGHVSDVECMAEKNDISVPVASLVDLEDSFTAIAKVTKDALLAITGMYHAVINYCPDRRVVHLALDAKKARTRKKNRNRAFRILEEN